MKISGFTVLYRMEYSMGHVLRFVSYFQDEQTSLLINRLSNRKVNMVQYMRFCYGKCSKILNTFLFLFSKKLFVISYHGWNSQNACGNSKQGRPRSDCFFRSSLIWVCTVCLGPSLKNLFLCCHPTHNFQGG